MYELNICHLYPDLLNLYGDRGNVMAIKKRCEWRNIEVNVSNVSLNNKFDASQYDIVFLGGGQDYEQEIIINDFINQKGNEIKNAIQNNKVFLAICGGYQILGDYYKTWDGKELKLLGAIDIYTIGGKKRLIGDFVFNCDFLINDKFDGNIIGFENHSGKTYLGSKVKPLGKILKGKGNNGKDKTEGAVYKNVFCTYSHGSLLPKNQTFTDYLISTALKQKYSDFTQLSPLNDDFEIDAHNYMINRLLK